MMKIKTSQKNQLFQAITDSQLNVGMFKYHEYEDILKAESQITVHVVNQPFKFEMSESYHGSIKLVFSPGTDRIQEESIVKTWDEIIEEFYTWVDNVAEEVNIEDKWANLDKFIEDTSLETNNNILNDKFSVTEYLEIKDKIDNLRIQFSKIDLTTSQLTIINDKLDIVLEQTKNLGKFDWRSFFIGTIMSIILQLSLSQDQGKQIWKIIKSVFSNYFLT